MKIKFKKLNDNAILPSYAIEGDAGLDLTAISVDDSNNYYIQYQTGLSVEIPVGYVGLIFPRSSVTKTDLMLGNSVGVIDCVPPGTMIKTPSGDITVDELFELNQPKVIYSFNESKFDIEEDLVSDMWKVYNKECIEISTETSKITIPVEKEVFTRRGWVKATDLTYDDEILEFS